MEAVNTETGERYYQFGENLLNGEMFVSPFRIKKAKLLFYIKD